MSAADPDPPDLPPIAADRPPRSVSFLLSQLGFLASRRFGEALKPVGIEPREWALLRFVAAAEGQSQQALAERLGIPPSRMVALVDRLEEAGLLARRPDPEDRRVRGLYLTAQGRQTLGRAVKEALAVEHGMCSGLEEPEREQLIELLQKLQAAQPVRRGVHPGLGGEPRGG